MKAAREAVSVEVSALRPSVDDKAIGTATETESLPEVQFAFLEQAQTITVGY